jgi:hypothetical protein
LTCIQPAINGFIDLSKCDKLGKLCKYDYRPGVNGIRSAIIDAGRIERTSKRTNIKTTGTRADAETAPQSLAESAPLLSLNEGFPYLYFLDSKQASNNPQSLISPQSQVPEDVLVELGDELTRIEICQLYFSIVQSWAPFLSRKRVNHRATHFEANDDRSFSLLLLCMKLVCSDPGQDGRIELYWKAKQFTASLEQSCDISFSLLQSLILISLYEIWHGICPAGYLTTSHAARLGYVFGLHGKKGAPRLSELPNTMSGREEERRAWWTIVMLDKYVALGMYGAPPATGEPIRTELLPCDDLDWNLGTLGSNQPLFTPQSSWSTNVGYSARVCQAVHILGKVIRHRNDDEMDKAFRFEEARQLNITILALSSLLQTPTISFDGPVYCDDAIALCCSARFLLCALYACNEDYDGDPTGQEQELQRISLQGIKETVEMVYQVSVRARAMMMQDVRTISPLMLHCVEYAAAEAAWFYREDHTPRMKEVFDGLIETLKLMNQRWLVAGGLGHEPMGLRLTKFRTIPAAARA